MKRSVFRAFQRLFHSDSEGGALVEMAVTLPLIMLIMTGIFSFSMALYQKLQLAETVAAAGRQLAVDRGDHDPLRDDHGRYRQRGTGTQSNLAEPGHRDHDRRKDRACVDLSRIRNLGCEYRSNERNQCADTSYISNDAECGQHLGNGARLRKRQPYLSGN